jgi:uncharacterized protein (DUF2147 family)
MMNQVITLLFTICFLNNIQAQPPSDRIVGTWLIEDKTSKIEIFKTGNSFSGKIVWISELEKNPNQQPKDKNNPKPELRNRNILGMDIITGLQYASDKWVKGTIYTPKKGVYADCKVELLSNGQLKIIASKSGINKKQIWTRK